MRKSINRYKKAVNNCIDKAVAILSVTKISPEYRNQSIII